MKKLYIAPSIVVVEYNHVDVVTSSINNLDYTTIKGSWIDVNWLDN